MTNKTLEKASIVYDRLLDLGDELDQEGITTPEMARGTACFLVELCFDTAPSSDYAMHLLLSAITARLERNIDDNKKEVA